MPTDPDLLWGKLCEVEASVSDLAEKVDQLTRLIKARRKRTKRRIGFGCDVIPGGGIPQDPTPSDEGE